MHLLVTRPEADAAELKARLESMGHRVSLAPLLGVELDAAPAIDLGAVQALIATSRNGLRALAGSPVLESAARLPILVVGPATAALARKLGFARVMEGPGSAPGLVALATAELEPRNGTLLHLAGDRQAFDLKCALERHGFEVRQPVLYRTRPAGSLTPEVADAIRSGSLDGVILMSPRTAEIFATLVAGAGLVEEARGLLLLCLSTSVANRLAALSPIQVRIAARPNANEMLALVTAMAAKSD